MLLLLVFTNVAETSDGGVYWEGMDEIPPNGTVTSWLGEPWTTGTSNLNCDVTTICLPIVINIEKWHAFFLLSCSYNSSTLTQNISRTCSVKPKSCRNTSLVTTLRL